LIRKGIRARVRPALDLPGRGGYRRVFPFRKSWIAIGILAAFDAVFIIPAIFVFQQAAEGWARFDDLFDLVAALFSSAWLLGWSATPLLMTAILLLMLFGREVVRVRGDKLTLFIGLPGVGLSGDYLVSHMRNLRAERPIGKSGRSWRGPHLVFDYGANDVAFGSNAGDSELGSISSAIEAASGQSLRRGDATPEELEGKWAPAEIKLALREPEQADAVDKEPIKWSSPTALALIIANLVPLAGAVFFGWNLGEVMVLYWAESGIIGFYNVCKIAVISRWGALLFGVFFLAHYGAFMSVHFLFIYMLFVKGPQDMSGGDLAEVGQMFLSMWPALLALFLSHGLSFFQNFMGRDEYRGRNIQKQMGEPYTRIVLMHLVIIFGGGLALVLGSPTLVILLVIAGKIVFDLRAHIKQRAAS